MGRRAVLEGVIERGELLDDVLLAHAHEREGFEHDLGVVISHSARGKLDAVADDVVLIGEHFERILLFERLHPALRHGEGIVAEFELAALLADLIHGEVDDPAEAVNVLFKEIEPRAEHGAEDARALLDEGELVLRDKSDERAVFKSEPLFEGFDALRNEFCDAARRRAVLVQLEPEHGAALRLDFELFGGLVDPLAGDGNAVDGDGFDFLAFEGGESAAFRKVGDVLDDKGIAKVGLIRAVRFERFAVGDAAERGLIGIPARILGKDGREHPLEHFEDVFLRRERHLDIQLIELAGRTVGAGVLVTEAGGDLEVLVEPRAHQELLVLLRRLRERIELAGIDAAGNDVVARALGRRTRQNRRVDLVKAALGHELAKIGDDLRAQNDLVAHGGVAQIEEAVFEARVLARFGGVRNFEGKRLHGAAAQHFDALGDDLDKTRGELVVGGRAQNDGAFDADRRFGGDVAHLRKAGLFRADDLRGAVKIAQDGKEKAALIALAVEPAREFDALARVRFAQLAAVMSSEIHGCVLLWFYS